VRKSALADFAAGLARARDTLARGEKRIERLEQKIDVRAGGSSRRAQ
ncbi:sterol-binding protein, partial [Burkholderia pseudomallei]